MPELQLRGGEVDGLRLHYVVEGRGPAVIFVHGLGGFAESWRHNVRPLANRATVYSVDLPGFGESAKPRTHYRLGGRRSTRRSEEHTSELQSLRHLVCRLLLEKKTTTASAILPQEHHATGCVHCVMCHG